MAHEPATGRVCCGVHVLDGVRLCEGGSTDRTPKVSGFQSIPLGSRAGEDKPRLHAAGWQWTALSRPGECGTHIVFQHLVRYYLPIGSDQQHAEIDSDNETLSFSRTRATYPANICYSACVSLKSHGGEPRGLLPTPAPRKHRCHAIEML